MLLEVFRRVFIPTVSQRYLESQSHYDSRYGSDIESAHRVCLSNLNDVLDIAERTALFHLNQENMPKFIDEYDLVSTVCDSIQKVNILRTRKKEVEEMIASYQHLRQCQTALDWTGYHDLQDFASGMYNAYSFLATSLITLSLAGAAIVYATIFSAARGNIGLMVFTFPLFSTGFVIPALIQLCLSWIASRKRSIPFASQPFWKSVIGLFMGISSIAVAVAIIILNYTVFGLRKDSDTLEDTVPRMAGIVVFAFSGGLVFLFLFSIALSVACGPRDCLRGDSYRNKQGRGRKLEEFDHRGTVFLK